MRLNSYEERKKYLESIIFSMSDPERIKTVITMCEGLEVIVEDNRIMITNKAGDIGNRLLQDIWDECWKKLKTEGLKIVLGNKP